MRALGTGIALALVAGCTCERPVVDRDAGPRDASIDAPVAIDAPRADVPPLPIDAPPDHAADTQDGGCGVGFALRGVPPNVLILMPRSCYHLYPWDASSGMLFEPSDPRSTYAKALEGIHEFIETYPGRIRWGLLTYPEGPSAGPAPRCGVPPIDVEPQDGGGSMVLDILDDPATPLSRTYCMTNSTEFSRGPPMTAALVRARESTALHEPGRNQFVLVISAANDHCFSTTSISCDGVNAATDALLADGIRTIALSPSQNTPTEMGCVADHGGFPLPPPGTAFPGTHFYSLPWADTVEHLVDAITDATFSCTFPLDEVPPDADDLYVFADDVMIARDVGHTSGWDYDAASNAVTLYGPDCDRARDADFDRLSATWGCPEPRCVPVTEICDGLDNDCNDVVDDAPDCLI